jgi:hypothetical protein
LVIDKFEQVTRLAPKHTAQLAKGFQTWLNIFFADLIKVDPMNIGQPGQLIATVDAPEIHQARDLRPQKFYWHSNYA